MRAFLALEPDAASRDAVSTLIERLRPKLPHVSWVRPDNIHLTLRFLGHVSPDFIDAYSEKLAPIAATTSRVAARLDGVGAFPGLRRPSVVWVGMSFDGPSIRELQAASEAIARKLGLPPETRAFLPHVTIGRVKRDAVSRDVAAFLEQERQFRAHEFPVDAVSLFSSELSSQGARYTRLRRMTLDGLRS